ncbi:hypothetical protein ACOKFD_12945 [Flagellimonas sp. S174]|uniref:hypothetical protein n=1 Tax=Flagellimonas sp. S174 TaxID=3410790 RepID=UPI0026342E30|nr:hypothetical protein [uncultured Allomuricauda sp.]
MKRVREIEFFKNIREIREYEFGIFYFFDNLVISEINEGVHFDWEMATKAVDAAYEVIGRDNPIAYISNRVNSYSVVAADWRRFYFNRHQLDLYSVVGSTQGNFASLVLERMFFRNNIRQFSDLDEAIEWSLSKLEEQKEITQ